MSSFKMLCQLSGLMTIDDAANFLDIKRQSCQRYWYGEENPPDGIIFELKDESIKISGLKRTLEILPAEKIVEMMHVNDN